MVYYKLIMNNSYVYNETNMSLMVLIISHYYFLAANTRTGYIV